MRGVGLLGALEFVADKALKRRFDPALQVGARVAQACLDRGMIARAMPQGDILRFAPRSRFRSMKSRKSLRSRNRRSRTSPNRCQAQIPRKGRATSRFWTDAMQIGVMISITRSNLCVPPQIRYFVLRMASAAFAR